MMSINKSQYSKIISFFQLSCSSLGALSFNQYSSTSWMIWIFFEFEYYHPVFLKPFFSTVFPLRSLKWLVLWLYILTDKRGKTGTNHSWISFVDVANTIFGRTNVSFWLPKSTGWRKEYDYVCHQKKKERKKWLYLSVNVFSTKVIIGDTIFYVSNWTRDRHFTWSSEPREGLACCSAKEVPSFLGYFKTLSIGPAPGIEPATSRSAINALYRLS